ncbi:MAG: hypothetical protein QM783_12720 [Phycisphaerales bacterium]
MQSVAELYNQEVLEGHREALAALRELLAQETDPSERRKLANAILRARPVKRAKTDQPPSPSTPRPPARANPDVALNLGSGTALDPEDDVDSDDAFDIDPDDPLDLEDDDRGPDEALDRKADELSRRLVSGPDRHGALRELHAFMLECADAVGLPRTTPESF